MSNKKIKIAIIGAGPGGYEAAILAGKLGAEVTLIEEGELGGVCLNRGCIPTKVFLNTANKVKEIKEIKSLDIETNNPQVNFSRIVERKNKNINQLKKGINSLIKENGVELIKGKGKLVGSHDIEIQRDEGKETINADFIILATGSKPILPENFNYNGTNIISTDDLFDLSELPKSIVVAGGGVAAIEISQYLARFGVNVTIVEAMDHILPDLDEDVVRKFNRVLKKDKIKILTKSKITKIETNGKGVSVQTENGKILEAEMALICIGRIPNTEYLFNENLEIDKDNSGFIKVDEFLRTSVPTVYAIGDIVASPMLAHIATHEGLKAVKNIISGNMETINYHAVPNTIFTEPEIASVGLTEQVLKEKGQKYLKGTFPFRLLGKSLTLNRREGYVKLLTDTKKKIIGASIFGTHASDLIMELVLAIHTGMTSTDLMEMIHPHPSLSEAILEASRDVSNLSINQL